MRKITTSEERLTLGSKAFRQYLNEIHTYNTLTPDEEYELCVKMKDGDEEAREMVIKHNLRFVVSVAKKYYGTSGTLEDLVNEGNMGLIIATKHYDPSRGFKFISYAVWWIRRNILFFLNNMDSIVRVPNHKLSIINKIKEDYMRLEQELQKQPTSQDLIHGVGSEYSVEDINLFYSHYLSSTTQLDKEIGGEGETTTTIIELMVDTSLPHTDSLVQEEDATHRIRKMMQHLNKKQAIVIIRTFGLDGKEPKSLESIGAELGVTKERVRQIKEKSLLILRNKTNINYIYI